ncbi:hypothetical protein FOZ63_016524, partial [Perkinsus olseni]
PGDQYANVNETPVADGINNANQGLVNQQRWSPTVRTNPNREAGTFFHNFILFILEHTIALVYSPDIAGALQVSCIPRPASGRLLPPAGLKEMKTVKALKKPEQGKFLGMVDKRSGLGFRLEVIRNCGRLSPIVVHHYLREHVCMDVHKSIGIGDDWPLNCDADYSNSVNVIWDRLTT